MRRIIAYESLSIDGYFAGHAGREGVLAIDNEAGQSIDR